MNKCSDSKISIRVYNDSSGLDNFIEKAKGESFKKLLYRFTDCNKVIAILTVKKSIEVATETMKIMLKNSGKFKGISFGFGQYRQYSFEFRPSVILVK